MGKSAPRAPTPPDPAVTAAAQTASNETTARTNARLNRVDQYTPYGNIQYRENDGDRWVATQTLDPSQQRQLDLSNSASETYGRAANAQLGKVEGALSQPFNPDLPALQTRADFTGIGDPNQSRDAVEAALNARQAPLQERDRAGLETRLANQGLQPGTAAYDAAMANHYRAVNDARLATTAQAGQEQSRVFGLGMGQAAFGNQARGQSLVEQTQLRNQPINEASALITGNMIQNPTFANVAQAQVAPTDYLGAVGQQQAGQLAAYNAANQRYTSNLQGMYSLAGQALGSATTFGMKALSDRRIKRNVERVGTWHNGLPIYEFEYLWSADRYRGFMAHEVAAVRPDAVLLHPSGFAMVDYSIAAA